MTRITTLTRTYWYRPQTHYPDKKKKCGKTTRAVLETNFINVFVGKGAFRRVYELVMVSKTVLIVTFSERKRPC